MKELISILKESNVSDFVIQEKNTQSQEVFFVEKKLDMGRAKNVTHTTVTVYVDSEDKKFRGSATKEIHPTSTKEEMKREIENAIFAASYVKNPWHPVAEAAEYEGENLDVNLSDELVKLTKAMLAVKAKENEKLNSFEIFVNKKRTHILNSKGVDVSFSSFDCEIEVVINASEDKHEIELIKILNFANKDTEEITKEVEAMFESGHARLAAAPTKQNEHATVLLTGDDLPIFFRYFLEHTNAMYQYMGVARAKIGEKFIGDGADPLTIVAKPILEGSTHNVPYDGDGKLVKEKNLFVDGVCKSFWGSVQHAHYLGLEDASSVNNVVVSGGTMSLEDMKKIPHLEITDFSAFTMDPIGGNFGGEIRLGYEYDGENRKPVAGGSLSANYTEVLKNIQISKETKQINHCEVPCAVLLRDVVVAGE